MDDLTSSHKSLVLFTYAIIRSLGPLWENAEKVVRICNLYSARLTASLPVVVPGTLFNQSLWVTL
jgi:hypothetical protein